MLFIAFLMLSPVLRAQDAPFGFSGNSAVTQTHLENLFLENVDFTAFRKHLEIISKQPHITGTPENEEVRDYLMTIMEASGYQVDLYPYDVYLPNDPGTSLVEIVSPVRQPLNQQEYILKGDPYSDHPLLQKGWNAYSGSGDVTAEIVYANYGTKADFEKLKQLGVDIKGKIVLARYGGNFRGYKAKFAEENGAAGLLIFTDPQDSGFAKGLVYPEGIYYNESAVQRGSLLTEKFTGDPLTPFEPALPLDGEKKINRLDPKETHLHHLPVTAIPYGSADKIIGRMKGKVVPSGWQGGLAHTYRLEGGPDLKVRIQVDQPIGYVRINNVVGTLKGSEFPDEWVILGCHYDAWSFGATDPNSGTAMLLTLAESLGKLSKKGYHPKRSVLIAHWDGEEHGVIGSTEWVEEMREALDAKTVAYLNFDAGVSGRNLGGAAAPSLKMIMTETAKKVQFPDSSKTFFDVWRKENESPNIGNLGGGSDHIAFYMHVGIPSLSGGAGGPTLYHTNYDNLHFYETFADPSFQMGGAVAQWAGLMALRLANAELIPYHISQYALDLESHFGQAEEKIKVFSTGMKGFPHSKEAIKRLSEIGSKTALVMQKTLESNQLSHQQMQKVNKMLIDLERCFILEEGMPFGNWYKSLYASIDPYSGYASWMLPAIQYEIENKRTVNLRQLDKTYAKAIENLNTQLEVLYQYLSNINR